MVTRAKEAVFGGDLRAGPLSGGGFRVLARFPASLAYENAPVRPTGN
jgi:hypothetical protein